LPVSASPWRGRSPARARRPILKGCSPDTSFSLFPLFLPRGKASAPPPFCSMAEVRSVINFGLFNTGERCVSFIATNFEKPLIGRLYTMADLGLYTVVNQLITRPVSLISGAFSRVAYSLYSKVHDDHANAQCSLHRLFRETRAHHLPHVRVHLSVFRHRDHRAVRREVPARGRLPGPALRPRRALVHRQPLSAYLMALNKANIGFYLNCVSVVVTAGYCFAGSRFSMQTMLTLWVAAVVVVLLPIEWTLRYRLTKMSLVKVSGKGRCRPRR
jgi:hypothetical protein